jgi:putative transcriptional regulator
MPRSPAEPRLSNRLRVARAERDLSQGELARLVGVSRQTISSIETGQYGPSTLLALRLARVLAARVDELFSLEDPS